MSPAARPRRAIIRQSYARTGIPLSSVLFNRSGQQ